MPPLRNRELLLSLKYATIEGCFSMPMLNLTLGNMPFVIGFAIKVLGWNSALIGWLAAMPFICFVVQPPITYFLQRIFSFHEIVLLGFVVNALPWAFVSLFPSVGEHRHAVFAAIVFISNLANCVCAVAWAASMSELVPLNIRGKYFGRRNLFFGFWVLLVVLAAGRFVDARQNSIEAFAQLFAAAAAARLIGMFFFTRMRFPPAVTRRQTQTVTWGDYLAVLRDGNYMKLLLFIGLWGFSLNLGMPFYNMFILTELPFSIGDLLALTIVASVGGLISLRTWGALSDRYGNKPVLITCALLWSASAMFGWLFAGPTRFAHLYINYFLVGFMTAGFQLCQFNLMIKLVSPARKAQYISVFFAFTSFLTALGPILGGLVLRVVPRPIGFFLGQPVLNYHLLFGGSLLLCLISVNILQVLREPSERPWRELLRQMRSMREFNPLLGLGSLAQLVFNPQAVLQLARHSLRSLRRQTNAVSGVGEELVEHGWRAVKRPFEKDPDQP